MEKITQKLPVAEVKETGQILLEGGRQARGYRLDLSPEGSMASQAFGVAIEGMHRACKELPIGSIVQTIDVFYDATYHAEPAEVDEAIEKDKFFKYKRLTHFEGRPLLRHHSFLFVILEKGVDNKVFATFENSFSVEKIQRLDGAQALSLLHQYVNQVFEFPQENFNPVERTLEGIAVSGSVVGIVSMESQSSDVYTCVSSEGLPPEEFLSGLYLNYAAPHTVVKAFRIEDTGKILRRQLRQADLARNLSLRAQDAREAERVQQETLELEDELSAASESIVTLNLHVVCPAKGMTTLKQRLLEVQARLRDRGIRSTIESFRSEEVYFAAAPACAQRMRSGQPMALRTALAYNNFQTFRKGEKKGVLLADRHGYPIRYNPFNTTLDNQNAFIFGASGSGKSFFNGKLLKDRYEDGHRLIVIDSGGTYRHLFEGLGGKYIEYGYDKPLGLNPFTLHDKSFLLEKIALLTHFIGKVWKGDLQKNPMSEAERALLGRYIQAYYETKGTETRTLTGFADFLKKSKIKKEEAPLFNKIELLVTLEPFTTGIYGEHFNGKSEENIEENRLICFEIEKIKENAKLYPLVMQVLFDHAFSLVERYPTEKKFIDIEEGWAILDEVGEGYIETLFRKGRKTNTSIRLITQDIEEVKNSRIAGALKNNASTFILLGNTSPQSRNEIGAWLGLSTHDMEKYASLQQVGGRHPWREIFIKEMDVSKVCRIETSPYEHALLTSQPDERNAIAALSKEKGDLEMAVVEWVERRKKKYNN